MASFVAQGGVYTWTATIRDGSGDLADCADLALMISDPEGDDLAGFPVEAPAIVRTGLGEYEYEWTVGIAATLGVYDADWSGTVDGLAVGGSDSIQVVVPGSIFTRALSYATTVDLQESLQREETDTWVISQMETALVDGTDRITQEIETDFFRHPAAGTEVRLVNGNGSALLHVHGGIVSLSQVRVRTSRTADWETLAATDYDLESRAAPEDVNQPAALVYPYDHVRLNGTGDYSRWPKGQRLIEFTGAFGWPAVPRRISADRTYPGGVISPDEAGAPILPSRLPDAVYRLKAWASSLHQSCGV
jgi:hypothetical protein